MISDNIQLNPLGIPEWLISLSNILVEQIHPIIRGETEENYSSKIYNTWIYINFSEISDNERFNTWFKNFMTAKGFKLISYTLGENMYNEARLVLFNKPPGTLFVDFSKQHMTKYIMDSNSEIYSTRQKSFEDIDIFLCGSDGTPPLKISFSHHNISWMMNIAEDIIKNNIITSSTEE